MKEERENIMRDECLEVLAESIGIHKDRSAMGYGEPGPITKEAMARGLLDIHIEVGKPDINQALWFGQLTAHGKKALERYLQE